jgi:hypothetical protein
MSIRFLYLSQVLRLLPPFRSVVILIEMRYNATHHPLMDQFATDVRLRYVSLLPSQLTPARGFRGLPRRCRHYHLQILRRMGSPCPVHPKRDMVSSRSDVRHGGGNDVWSLRGWYHPATIL